MAINTNDENNAPITVEDAMRKYFANTDTATQQLIDNANEAANSQPNMQRLEAEKPVRSTTYEDLYKQYYDTPMSKEEEDRRKRAATAVNGIAGLGNVANAFANLIYTGKGAPNMALPTYKGADLQAFSDKAAQARRLYADAQIKGRQLDDNSYNQNRQLYNQAITTNNNISQQEYQNKIAALGKQNEAINAGVGFDRDKANMAQSYDNNKKTWDFKNKEFEEQNRVNNANLAIRNAELNLQRQKYKDAKVLSLLQAGGDSNTSRLWDSGKNPYMFTSMTDMATLANFIEEVGVDEKSKQAIETAAASQDEKALAAAYSTAVGKAMARDKSGQVRDMLLDAGLITPIQKSTGNIKTPWTEKGGIITMPWSTKK